MPAAAAVPSSRSRPTRTAPTSTSGLSAAAGRATGRPTSSSPMPTPPSRTRPGDVAVRSRADAAWVEAWTTCEGRPDARAHADEVLARIEPATGFAIAADGKGVGLAVCERGWAGLFCVATAPEARGSGVARTVVHALTRGATGHGAQRIYLQVESDNAPARALYASAGFTRSHGYHYRVAPA